MLKRSAIIATLSVYSANLVKSIKEECKALDYEKSGFENDKQRIDKSKYELEIIYKITFLLGRGHD